MQYGVHLPLLNFSTGGFSLSRLLAYVEAAEHLGFRTIAVTDHIVTARPWLDGPTALAASLPKSGKMRLAMSVALPVIRNPVILAKTLASLDVLSGGRLIAGVGAGSSAQDYAAVGIPIEDRWTRFEEAVHALRSLWRAAAPFSGHYYRTAGVTLEPPPAQVGGPPIWIGSWGSDAGLRRVARLADGWLASAYNATPSSFAVARARLQSLLLREGRDPEAFPNAVSTMFCYVTSDHTARDRVLSHILSKVLNRPPAELQERLLVGTPEECAIKLAAYRAAGAEEIYLWPVADEIRQLELIMERVLPMVPPM